jgi:DNA-binding CsgD family transcriptional regulator
MHKLGAPTRLAAAVQATAERRSPEDARYTLTSTSRDHAELLRERRRGGCDLVPLASAARSYPGAQANSVAEGSVSTLEDASSVIAAAYRGHSVVACLDAAPAPMRTVLTDSLRRLGLVELREHGERRAPALTALQQRVLDGLSRGATIAHLAAEEGLSRRTVERRLAQARDLLGAETTTEAVTRHRQRDRFNKTEELGGGDGV